MWRWLSGANAFSWPLAKRAEVRFEDMNQKQVRNEMRWCGDLLEHTSSGMPVGVRIPHSSSLGEVAEIGSMAQCPSSSYNLGMIA